MLRMRVESQLDAGWQYTAKSGFFDELLTAGGQPRAHWKMLLETLSAIGPADLERRWQEGRRIIHDHGITYNVYEDPQTTDRPWPLDAIPLAVGSEDWAFIEKAIVQRAKLLNQILADLYGGQELLRNRLLPPELVFRNPAFLRACHGVKPPHGIHLHIYSADIARSADGAWWVLGDRSQAPSGAGYALENRLVTSRVLPDVFRSANVRRLAEFFKTYRDTLRSLVPAHRENPRIVLLTPGPYNETYFEQAFLARYLGFTLVEGADLTVRDDRVFLKTLGGLLPVDVIVRRQDDSFCDPLELRGDSMLGIAGLVQAARSGNVAIANALGSGLVESAAPSGFLPGLCRHLLDEELLMPSVAAWWCGQPGPQRFVEQNLANLVIKPVFPSYGKQPVFGAKLSAKQRATFIEKLRAEPGLYVAQEQMALSTAPVWDNGRLTPRHMVLRVFAVAAGGTYTVMPGGLTRVSSSVDSLNVSMQGGGGSKDTWVFAKGPEPQTTLLRKPSSTVEVSRATFDLPSRVADNLFWLGRYSERIEPAVRSARAVMRRISQEADPSNSAGLDACFRVLAALEYIPAPAGEKHSPAEHESAVLDMIYDSEARGSLGWNIHQVRRVAWLLRDRISADAWRILNRLDQQFSVEPPPPALRASRALELIDQVIQILSAFSGLVMDGMTRGYGWRFLEIGRRLEKALRMVEMLLAVIGAGASTGQLEALLEMADSSITYRSRYLTSMQANLVVDLLLVDEANPRSVAFQFARLNEHVAELPESQSLTRRPAEARLALSLLTTVQLTDVEELVKPTADGRLTALEKMLTRMASDIKLLSEKLNGSYFTHAVASRRL